MDQETKNIRRLEKNLNILKSKKRALLESKINKFSKELDRLDTNTPQSQVIKPSPAFAVDLTDAGAKFKQRVQRLYKHPASYVALGLLLLGAFYFMFSSLGIIINIVLAGMISFTAYKGMKVRQ